MTAFGRKADISPRGLPANDSMWTSLPLRPLGLPQGSVGQPLRTIGRQSSSAETSKIAWSREATYLGGRDVESSNCRNDSTRPLTPGSVAGVSRRVHRRAYRRGYYGNYGYGYSTFQPSYGYGYQPYNAYGYAYGPYNRGYYRY
jgi:hypothetical protein